MSSHDQYRFDTTPLSSDPSKVFNLGIYYQGLHLRNFDVYIVLDMKQQALTECCLGVAKRRLWLLNLQGTFYDTEGKF